MKFDVTVNLMDDNNLYYIGIWDSEGENCECIEEMDEVVLGYTWLEKTFTEIAFKNNCIVDDGEIYFNKKDATKVKNIIIKALKETNHYTSLENEVYVIQ
jgi:hypothetical protein